MDRGNWIVGAESRAGCGEWWSTQRSGFPWFIRNRAHVGFFGIRICKYGGGGLLLLIVEWKSPVRSSCASVISRDARGTPPPQLYSSCTSPAVVRLCERVRGWSNERGLISRSGSAETQISISTLVARGFVVTRVGDSFVLHKSHGINLSLNLLFLLLAHDPTTLESSSTTVDCNRAIQKFNCKGSLDGNEICGTRWNWTMIPSGRLQYDRPG